MICVAAGKRGVQEGGGVRGRQADTRLHAPRLRLNNKLELFILATLFATDRHLLQGLGMGVASAPHPQLKLSKIAAVRFL